MKEIQFKKLEGDIIKSLSIHPLIILPRQEDTIVINEKLYNVHKVVFDYDDRIIRVWLLEK